MSGHSKWSTIKHQKQITDKNRGQIFTKLANAISLSVREGGGGDPATNFKLRLAIDKARSANMPKDNIERAIAKATGNNAETNAFTEVIYEGFAPFGVGVMASAVTDNTQRTVSKVKNVFSIFGGNLGGAGSVGYLFEHIGEIMVPKDKSLSQILEISSQAGAKDIEETDDNFIVITVPNELHQVKNSLENQGLTNLISELTYRPQTTIKISDESQSKRIVDFLHTLLDLDDIHKVYSNMI